MKKNYVMLEVFPMENNEEKQRSTNKSIYKDNRNIWKKR